MIGTKPGRNSLRFALDYLSIFWIQVVHDVQMPGNSQACCGLRCIEPTLTWRPRTQEALCLPANETGSGLLERMHYTIRFHFPPSRASSNTA